MESKRGKSSTSAKSDKSKGGSAESGADGAAEAEAKQAEQALIQQLNAQHMAQQRISELESENSRLKERATEQESRFETQLAKQRDIIW